ncbi:MAG: hypothetical protein ACKO7P_08860 [Bacteroidota bacterium]
MKNLFLTLTILIINFASFCQKGVIYNFAFRIDDELVTQMKAQNKEHKLLNIATIEEMPKELSDTILLITEKMLGKSLEAELFSMRPEDKLIMAAVPQHLMYLPANMFKKAVKNNDELNYYVDISCHIAASGGVEITLANNTYSKVKPKLSLTIKVYDKDKNELQTKEAKLKDFNKLRAHTFNDTYGIQGLGENNYEITEAETINATDVLRMYVMGLTDALK